MTKAIRSTVISLFAVVFGCLNANAQLNNPGVIQGSVSDATTGNAIEFATVSLHLLKDSSLITGTISDQEGQFILKNIPEGEFYIKIGFIGYDDTTHSVVISSEQPMLVLDPLQLQASLTYLTEAEVTAEKNVVETHIDKRVYNVEKSIASDGGDGLEVLRNVPSVLVDQDGTISLRGNAGVTILVDGRPMAMDASTFLQQVPASSIEKVEVVTNPSAKYNPEGISGIINVIMKKNRASGFNGSLNASYGQGRYSRNNSSLTLNYRNSKINAFASGSWSDAKGWYGGKSDITFFAGDTAFSQNSRDEGIWNSRTPMLRAGVDYFMNERNTLYVSGTHGVTSQNGTREVYLDYFDNYGTYTASTDRFTNNDQPHSFYDLTAGWQRAFKKPGQSLDIDLNYQLAYAQIYDGYTTFNFSENDVLVADPSYQNTAFEDTTWVATARMDYVHPVTDSITVEAGWMTILRDVITDFQSESYLPGMSGFTSDTALNNQFYYSQQTHAAYVTFGQQLKKFGYKIGLRLEQTLTDAELVTTREHFDNDYLSLFPSIHISRKFSPVQELQASYSRRINRPQLELLNPFPSYSNPNMRQVGNPFLLPEFIDVYELGYIHYWKKFNLNATIYFRRINDLSRRYLSIVEDNISEVTFRNYTFANIYGAEIIATYTPVEQLRINATINVSQTQIDPREFDEDYDFNTPSASVQLMSTAMFKKGWSAQLFGSYQPRMPVLQGVIYPMYGMGVGARKNFWKRKGSLGVRFTDIFNTRRFSFDSAGLENYSNNLARDWQSQMVHVSFSYRFGKQLKGPQRRQNKANGSGDDFSLPDMQ